MSKGSTSDDKQIQNNNEEGVDWLSVLIMSLEEKERTIIFLLPTEVIQMNDEELRDKITAIHRTHDSSRPGYNSQLKNFNSLEYIFKDPFIPTYQGIPSRKVTTDECSKRPTELSRNGEQTTDIAPLDCRARENPDVPVCFVVAVTDSEPENTILQSKDPDNQKDSAVPNNPGRVLDESDM
ncbi:hypothetical protein RF11_05288 [Thelohanellus kitauei]|uniref:Uncharacterized protein n=1 Tax=Thelohanellus kitauei TaxID=669202 RepID=A0A0C2JI94_THEKT|nr:hypothetical protein RF11_05288 [Thelohanellus kitauei]